jgi:hypothetical protein
MSNISYLINQFFINANFDINIQGEIFWKKEDIVKVIMLALRSQVDNLSGNYSSYKNFITQIKKINIVEDLIPQRGVTVDEDLYDALLKCCNQKNIDFIYADPIYRTSLHRDHYMNFLNALGLDVQENYLLTRGWFCRSVEMQQKTLEVVLQGNGHKIDVKSSNYDEHINSLLNIVNN